MLLLLLLLLLLQRLGVVQSLAIVLRLSRLLPHGVLGVRVSRGRIRQEAGSEIVLVQVPQVICALQAAVRHRVVL